MYTVVLTVHPLNFSFDSSKLNNYAYTCTLLKLHYYVKDQQIDAKELQGCLTSSGISGSYHRKYDFMDFMHWFCLIIFISFESWPHTSRYWQKCGQVCSFSSQEQKWEKQSWRLDIISLFLVIIQRSIKINMLYTGKNVPYITWTTMIK